jgi:hypothetical protein
MAVKPAPPIKKIVVIEEALLISMANNQKFLKHFKFLGRLKRLNPAQRGGCSSCGGGPRKVPQNQTLIQSAKQNIVGMGSGQKRVLKKLLNTKQIRITIKTGKQIKQHTF